MTGLMDVGYLHKGGRSGGKSGGSRGNLRLWSKHEGLPIPLDQSSQVDYAVRSDNHSGFGFCIDSLEKNSGSNSRPHEG